MTHSNTQIPSENLSILSDLHKDVYGYRPRGKYSDFTNQELEKEIDKLSEMLEAQMEREKEQEKKEWRIIGGFGAVLIAILSLGRFK